MANIVDYQHLQQAKTKSEQKFDEMIQNLDSMRGQIVKMSGDTWKGHSSDVFNEVFEEIKKKIIEERERFLIIANQIRLLGSKRDAEG